MGKPSPAHLAMRELLTGMNLRFEEEMKVAGHRIDFVIGGPKPLLGVDVNGDRWHRWEKIRLCDVKKLSRVFAPEVAGVEPLVLGVWWTRLQNSPESVRHAIRRGILRHRLAWWDWAVTWEEMDALVPGSGARAASLVAAE